MMDYNDMLNPVEMPQRPPIPPMDLTAMAPQSSPAPYAAMQQPMPDVTAAQRPAANAQELERRMQGWTALVSKVQSDPALMQAMLVTGAHLMQPIQPGQTFGGNLGQSVMAGAGAFTQGKAQQFQQQVVAGREKRAQETHATEQAQAPLRTRALEAQVKGAEVGTDVAIATRDDAIKRVKTATKQAELDLEKGYGEEAVAKLERDVRAIRAYAQRNTADRDVQRAAEQADAALAHVKAQNEKLGAETKLSKLTADTLQTLPPDELRSVVKAHFGKHPTNSAIVQQMEAWGSLYEKLPESDPHKQGRTKEQYVADQIKAAKADDATKMRKAYVDSGGDDAEILQSFDDLIRAAVKQRGAGGDTTSASAPGKPITVKDAAHFNELVRTNKLKKGDEYIDPTGRTRTRQ